MKLCQGFDQNLGINSSFFKKNSLNLVYAIKQSYNSLLYTNDCVTVPGFGSFIVNKFSSVYDEKKENFILHQEEFHLTPKLKTMMGY